MEATSVARECTIISVPIQNPINYYINSQFQHPDTQNQDHDSSSDCESEVSSPNTEKIYRASNDGLIELNKAVRLYEIIKRRFVSGLGSDEMLTNIVSIQRNCYSSFWGQARAQSFQIFARAMIKKCGRDANLRYAWYGGERDEIRKIITHGFSHCVGGGKDGIYLAPDDSSIKSVKSSIADEDGLKHVLLCRVILGQMEQVCVGSKQSYPSSEEFDSGVDNLTSPNKYIIWSSRLNTHILPEYLISFRSHPSSKGVQRIQAPVQLPNSPWMPFRALISALTKFLPPDQIARITKYYDDHKEKKISRNELIRQVRKIAGDKLLTSIIKNSKNKRVKKSEDESPTNICYE